MIWGRSDQEIMFWGIGDHVLGRSDDQVCPTHAPVEIAGKAIDVILARSASTSTFLTVCSKAAS